MGRIAVFLLCICAACAQPATRDLEAPAWSDEGFVAIEPPVRLPKTSGGHDDVRVVVRIPAGDRIGVRWLPGQQRWILVYPEGTIAARVERWDGIVADVRGTRLDPGGGERFFVLRPRSAGRGLAGVEWSRGDAVAQREATRRLVEISPDPAAGAHLARQNDCASCHVHERSPSTGLAGPTVHRGTDAAGFFAPLTELADDAPLEDYKPRDLNLDDPFVSLRCGEKPALVDRASIPARAKCGDGTVPVAHLDLPRALQAGDAHATRVCESRRAIAGWLDDAATRAFAASIAECANVALP